MAKAVSAIHKGFDYQSRYFWLQACRLLLPGTRVVAVGCEIGGERGFDDVMVKYDPPIIDPHGSSVDAEYSQVKFHTDYSGSFGWKQLMDPAFIGATSVSLLQRLRDAQVRHRDTGGRSRFRILAPWSIDPGDALASLVSTSGGGILLDRLFQGGQKSRVGRVRREWAAHLKLGSEADLKGILGVLSVDASGGTLEGLQQRLDDNLRLAGLAPIEAGRRAGVYDDLLRKLVQDGRTIFSRASLEEILVREGLKIREPVGAPANIRRLGIRSFYRWAEYMEDRTDKLLCLLRYFDGRWLKDKKSWQDDVLPEIRSFLEHEARIKDKVHLELSAHASVAFAAGWILDPKSGTAVSPVQRGNWGSAVWEPSEGRDAEEAGWSTETEEGLSERLDMALVLSVTHDAATEAFTFIRERVPSVGRTLHLKIPGVAGGTSVRSGGHAFRLAQSAVALAAAQKTGKRRTCAVHLFAAAPNGLLFFLGQAGRRLGRWVLYEHDFDQKKDVPYEHSLVLGGA